MELDKANLIDKNIIWMTFLCWSGFLPLVTARFCQQIIMADRIRKQWHLMRNLGSLGPQKYKFAKTTFFEQTTLSLGVKLTLKLSIGKGRLNHSSYSDLGLQRGVYSIN